MVVAHYGKFWVYPILDALGPIFRILFFFFSVIILVGFYQLGKYMNSIIWKLKQKNKKK